MFLVGWFQLYVTFTVSLQRNAEVMNHSGSHLTLVGFLVAREIRYTHFGTEAVTFFKHSVATITHIQNSKVNTWSI